MKLLVVLAIVVAACVAIRATAPPPRMQLDDSPACDEWKRRPDLYRLIFSGDVWKCVPKDALLADTPACRAMGASLMDYDLRWNGMAYDCMHRNGDIGISCEMDPVRLHMMDITKGEERIHNLQSYQFECTNSETHRKE